METATCYISGESVLVSPSWSISDKINQRSTLSIRVVDLLNLTNISVGDAIEIYSDSLKIFSGLIQTVKKKEVIRGRIFYDLNCVDNTALADKRLIAEVAENKTAEYIIINLILPILAEEGVTQGNISCSTVVKKATFSYIRCSEALDSLKDLTGYNWNIDKDKQLNFFARSTYIAPFVLDSTIQCLNFEQEQNINNYRNKQYVRGGKCKTDPQNLENPTPKCDGQSRNFLTRYPIAQKPQIFINAVEVDQDDIGVNGLDEGKKWYFSYNSNTITQDSSETVLDSTKTLTITYVGLRDLFIVVEDTEEIENRAVIEVGTSGIYETLTKETSLDEKNQGLDFGNGLLVKYGEIKDKISFDTEVSGLQSGQLLTVDKPLFGIDVQEFLIESIYISPVSNDSKYLQYSVNALDGAAVGGWEEFFIKLIKGNRSFTIAENEVLIRLKTAKETSNYEGELQIKLYDCLYPSNTLFPSESLYPGTLNINTSLYD